MTHKGKVSFFSILLITVFSISCSSTTQWPFTMHNGMETDFVERSTEPSSFLQQEMRCANLECWDGIFPGLTTYNEAEILLEAKYGGRNVFIRNNRITWQSASVSNEFQSASLYANNTGIVDIIEVGFSEDQLAVLDLLSQIGEPSYIHVVRAFSSNASCAGSLIFFQSRGIVASLYPIGEFTGVDPDQPIQGLTLLSPEEAENWYMTDTIRIKWRGYDDYCNLAFPNASEGGH